MFGTFCFIELVNEEVILNLIQNLIKILLRRESI